MRLVIPQNSLTHVLPWTQRTLFACAASMLGFCAFVLVDTWDFQHQEDRKFERLLALPAAPRPSLSLATEGLIGRMAIPRLGLSAIVMEGTSPSTLRRAVGHIAGTALPGRPGNVGISGHRDTFFRPLQHIRQNDIITFKTLSGDYRYRVVSTKVVLPTEIEVLQSDSRELLTLVTCYPFYFVGSAPERFVVQAERAEGPTYPLGLLHVSTRQVSASD